MYTGNLGAASNRATWSFSADLTDDDTDEAVDLTDALLKIAIRDQQSKRPLLEGSTANGKVTIEAPSTGGVFSVEFTPEDMSNLPADHYDVGMTAEMPDGTVHQIIANCTLTVMDGVVDL